MALDSDQEKVASEAVDIICEVFCFDSEFARDARNSIDETLKERACINVNED